MNMHVSGTWLWANLLHPFVMYFYFWGNDLTGVEIFSTLFQLLLFTLFFSLPSLFVSNVAISLIVSLHATAFTKYIVWLFTATLIAFLNVLLFSGGDISFALEIGMPAMISVLAVTLLRYKYFFNSIDQLIKKENENNMV